MNICFVSHSARLGGAERALLEAIVGLRDFGVRSSVLLPATGPLAERLAVERVGCTVVPSKTWWAVEGGAAWRRWARTAWNAAALPRAVAGALRWRPDVVYTNSIATPLGAAVAGLLRIPHVWHFHELGYEHGRQVFDLGLRRSMRLVDRGTALCLANSAAVARKFEGLLRGRRPRVVYQSVSVRTGPLPPGLPARDGLRCVVLGALGEGKRQEEAVRAVADLVQAGHAAQLFVVGEGDPSYEARLRRSIAERGMGDRIFLLGALDNPFPLLEDADVLLVCARHEGFGRVTVEGMLAGCAVVGARSGGTEELIVDGRNGWSYEPGARDGLLESLVRLARNPGELREIGERARRWAVPRFTRERYAAELMEHLRELG